MEKVPQYIVILVELVLLIQNHYRNISTFSRVRPIVSGYPDVFPLISTAAQWMGSMSLVEDGHLLVLCHGTPLCRARPAVRYPWVKNSKNDTQKIPKTTISPPIATESAQNVDDSFLTLVATGKNCSGEIRPIC